MKLALYILLLIGLLSCTSKDKKVKENSGQEFRTIELRWAENFTIKKYKNYYKVELLNNGEVKQSFSLSSNGQKVNSVDYSFSTPVNSIASASCVYTKMFDELGDLDKIQGIDNLDYQYSSNTVQHVTNNKILEFGSGNNLKTEELFLLNPEVFFTWTSNQTSNQIKKLQKLKIPILFLSSYTEKHPLARAEWIKFFALFTGKLDQAEVKFSQTEKRYLKLQNQTLDNLNVLVNAPYSGQWYLPTSKSYMGHLLNDAKLSLISNNKDKPGAVSFSLEDVMAQYQNADLWINPGSFKSLNAILAKDKRFEHLKSFKTGQVYNSTKRIRENGGNDYWELGVIRPDLVLQDLQNIRNGLPNDSLFFFNKLKP